MLATSDTLAIPKPAIIAERLHQIAREQRTLRALLRVALDATVRTEPEHQTGLRERRPAAAAS